MTIELLLPNITQAISELQIQGVTIKNLDEISASMTSQANILYPNPSNFVTGFSLDYKTLPRGGDAKLDILYTLNYRLLGTQIGDLSNMPKAYSDLVEKVQAVVNALIPEHDPYEGLVDMELGQISIDAKADPAGNVFHGADIPLNIREYQNP